MTRLHRSSRRRQRPAKLMLETLEDRRLLAGDHVELLPDSVTVPEGSSWVELDVLANDEFAPDYVGERLISSASYASRGGAVQIAADGRSLLYQPLEGMFGEETLVYIVDDEYVANVTVSVEPALVSDEFEVIQSSGETTLDVMANDPFFRGYDGDRLITAVSGTSAGGTAEIAPDGRSIIYTPLDDFSGWERLRYFVDDRFETIVNVRVHRPVRDDHLSVERDSETNVLYVLSNDAYIDLEDRTQRIVEQITDVSMTEEGGTVTISQSGLSLAYTPPSDFVGTDRFSYIADDIYQANVSVSITLPVRSDSFTVWQNSGQQVLNVLANDFQSSGYTGPRLITSVTEASDGNASISPDGRSVLYTPESGFHGYDSFEYSVDDELRANVSVRVEPLARNDRYRFGVDPDVREFVLHVLNNDYFAFGEDGPGLITDVGEASNGGTVEIINGGRRLRYAPAELKTGYENFSYTVDGEFTADVSVNIMGFLSSDWNSVKQNSHGAVLSVLDNDFRWEQPIYDDGIRIDEGFYRGPRQITAVSESANGGSVEVGEDGTTLRYTPATDFLGEDRFDYTVDGVQSTTVYVTVVGYAREDRFRVDPDSTDNVLRVTVNDRVDEELGDQLRIDRVDDPAAGGEVTIDDEGQILLYEPAEGFTGTDTFAYHLNNGSRAQVTIEVVSAHEQLLPRFADHAELEQFLIDDALERYAGLFGQPVWYWDWYGVNDDFIQSQDAGAAPERSHSETNVQVAGVDEGDIIEVDADNLYVLTRDSLLIVDAWPAEELDAASRVELPGTPLVEYLHENRLTVISDTGVWIPEEEPENPTPVDLGGASLVDAGRFPYPRGQWIPSVTVTVFDVSDAATPSIVQQTQFDGQYKDSRSINGFVYLVLQHPFALPEPEQVCTEPEPGEDRGDGAPVPTSECFYESREEYLERVQQSIGELATEALPEYTSYGPGGEFIRGGLLTEATNIFRPVDTERSDLLLVTAVDMTSNNAGPVSSVAIPAASTSQIYGSHDNLYVFNAGYDLFSRGFFGSSEPTASILKFAWNGDTGSIDFVSTGYVHGAINDQFSVDEHNGLLRIATTTTNYDTGTLRARSGNELFIFRDNAGVLEPVSSLKNLAPFETIRSVRFLGERAFVVTFRNIDPLFAIDLSDPYEPKNMGQLKIPGFSSYLQPIGENHVVGLGRNSPDGWSGPPQLSLFDISDLEDPVRVDQYTWDHWSTTEAAYDHHAFGFFPEHSLFAIPMGRYQTVRVDTDGDGFRDTYQSYREDDLYVFHWQIDELTASIDLRGTVSHEFQVRRSGYIGDRLYSVSTDDVIAADINDPSTAIAQLDFGAWMNGEDRPPWEVPYFPWPDSRVTIDPLRPYASTASPLDDTYLDEVVRSATSQMAEQLEIEPGQVGLVAVEADVYHASCGAGGAGICVQTLTPGYEIVLQHGASRSWYHATSGDDMMLMDNTYEFTTGPLVSHNESRALDVNADGVVSPIDALLVINALDEQVNGQRDRVRPLREVVPLVEDSLFVDANADGRVSPLDALLVINQLGEDETGDPHAPLSAMVTPTTLAAVVAPESAVHSGGARRFGVRDVAVTTAPAPVDAVDLDALSSVARSITQRQPGTALYDHHRRRFDTAMFDGEQSDTNDVAIREWLQESRTVF